MQYKDERFAKYSRFRYVVFNMQIRNNVRKQAFYLCKKIDGNFISLEDLQQQILEGGGELVNYIARSAEQIRGTRPFWNSKRNELNVMIRNLNCPHLFFTVSAADLQ